MGICPTDHHTLGVVLLCRQEALLSRGAIASIGTLHKVFALLVVLTLTLPHVDNSLLF